MSSHRLWRVIRGRHLVGAIVSVGRRLHNSDRRRGPAGRCVVSHDAWARSATSVSRRSCPSRGGRLPRRGGGAVSPHGRHRVLGPRRPVLQGCRPRDPVCQCRAGDGGLVVRRPANRSASEHWLFQAYEHGLDVMSSTSRWAQGAGRALPPIPYRGRRRDDVRVASRGRLRREAAHRQRGHRVETRALSRVRACGTRAGRLDGCRREDGALPVRRASSPCSPSSASSTSRRRRARRSCRCPRCTDPEAEHEPAVVALTAER